MTELWLAIGYLKNCICDVAGALISMFATFRNLGELFFYVYFTYSIITGDRRLSKFVRRAWKRNRFSVLKALRHLRYGRTSPILILIITTSPVHRVTSASLSATAKIIAETRINAVTLWALVAIACSSLGEHHATLTAAYVIITQRGYPASLQALRKHHLSGASAAAMALVTAVSTCAHRHQPHHARLARPARRHHRAAAKRAHTPQWHTALDLARTRPTHRFGPHYETYLERHFPPRETRRLPGHSPRRNLRRAC